MPRMNPGGASLPPTDIRAGESLLLRVDRTALTPGVPYSLFSLQNLVVNGGFEIWQRGNGPFAGNNMLTADMWRILLGAGAAISVVPTAATVMTGSGLAAAVTYTAGAGSSQLENKLGGAEWLWYILGQYISMGAWVRCAVPGAVRLRMMWNGDVPGPAYSAYNTGSAGWEHLTINGAYVYGNASYATCNFLFEKTAVVYLDNAMVSFGPVAQEYAVMSPADELERCQRYYEVHGASNNGFPRIAGYAGAGNAIIQPVSFCTIKCATPTVTKNGAWAVVNTGQPTVGSADMSGYHLAIAPTVLGAAVANPNSADDTITAEATSV